jgi:hypothetical protein
MAVVVQSKGFAAGDPRRLGTGHGVDVKNVGLLREQQ